MDILLRLEQEEDYRETEHLTREAFWDLYKPGCVEHLLAHKLRTVAAFVKELDYVACQDGKIVGNIMYSRAKVVDGQDHDHEVLCLGPISVLPEYQGKGIGSLLLTGTIEKALVLGYRGIFLMGKPGYYTRFGFVNAETFQIQTADGGNYDYFMGLELGSGCLREIRGRFHEDQVFAVGDEEVAVFDKDFPPKEKHVTDTQLK